MALLPRPYTQKPPMGVQINPAHPLSDGLVGCWPFNENGGDKVYDLSGNGNDGTLTDMAFPPTATSGWNPGKDGPALAFDNTDDYIDFGNNPDFENLLEMSISAWVYHNTISDDDAIVGNLDGSAGYYLFRDNSNPATGRTNVYNFMVDDGTHANVSVVTAVNSSPLREWTHIVVTFHAASSTGLRAYINGVEDVYSPVSVAAVTKIGNSSDSTLIGKSDWVDDEYNGLISEVRIWNRALTAQEVQQLYTEPYAMFSTPPLWIERGDSVVGLLPRPWSNAQKPPMGVQIDFGHPLADGLVGCWPFNENGGDKVYDLSGNGNVGTLTNMVPLDDWVPGKDGAAIDFGGVNDVIQIDSTFGITTGPITFSCWFRITSQPGSGVSYTIVNHDSDADISRGIVYKNDAGTYQLLFERTRQGVVAAYVTHNLSGPLEGWHHVVGDDNGSAQNIYLDGNLVEQGSLSGAGSSGGVNASSIGAAWFMGGGTYNFTVGLVDEVRIYNRALTAQEVQQLYSEPYAMFQRQYPAMFSPAELAYRLKLMMIV